MTLKSLMEASIAWSAACVIVGVLWYAYLTTRK